MPLLTRYIVLSGALLLYCFSLFGQQAPAPFSSNEANNSVVFIENRGQVHNQLNQPRPDVFCVGVSQSSQLIITASAFSHQLNRVHFREPKKERDKSDDEMQQVDSMTFSRVDLHWLNSQSGVVFEKLNPRLKQYNFYNLPHEPEGITGVREFESVRLKGIYSGIDVHFYDAGGLFEHDYEIAPGADYRNIKIRIEGTVARLNASGELVLETALGTITESSPVVFQNGKELKSKWIQLEEGVWGFDIPQADNSLAMVIDPLTRVWGTYYGGNSLDAINHIQTDDDGLIYTVGETASNNNIATAGAFQESASFGKDAMISKFDENGNQIWGTYLGGSGEDSAWGCDIKGDGILYVVGRTESTNNIATPGAHQATHGDGGNVFDGFVQRFTSDGIRVWGTYYGGEELDRCRYCHIDPDGNLYVAGVTKSFTNISTPGSHQEQYMGDGSPYKDDAMLIKFDPNGNRIWATYYGGAEWEEGFACLTDDGGNVFLLGHAQSSTNISTPGSFQPNHAGGTWDSFIAKFTSSGVRQWGTYIGGSGQDLLWSGTIDSFGNLYCAGRTQSTNGIATPGAHQEINGGDFDTYLMKFSNDGNKIWGTYLGGNQFERAYGCEITDNNFILLSGHTESTNSISTTQVHQENYGGTTDAFLSKLDLDGALQWSTYYGGTGVDVGMSCSSFSGNVFYLAGYTQSSSAISTPDIHQEEYAGGRDGFIAKFIDCDIPPNVLEINACQEYVAPDGETYNESGEYTAVFVGQYGCDSIITINLTIVDQFEIDQFHTICEGQSITLPDGTITAEEGVIVTEYVSMHGCDSIVSHHILITQHYEVNIDTTICQNHLLLDPEGNPISTSGEYLFTYSSIHGCDSIVHLNLEIIPSYSTSQVVSICHGDYFIAPDGAKIFTAGAYPYIFQSTTGCDSTVTFEVNILASPIAHFSTSPTGGSTIFEPTIQFFNESIGADYILWDFFAYGSSTQSNPTIEFTDTVGVHPVCLNVHTIEGCSDSICANYSIDGEFVIYIPNAFSPNEDGINDLFYVEGYGIDPDDFLLQIFNRWGEMIFESRHPDDKWNGEAPRGIHYVQNEVYTYKVLIGSLYSTDKFDFIGRVTIIR